MRSLLSLRWWNSIIVLAGLVLAVPQAGAAACYQCNFAGGGFNYCFADVTGYTDCQSTSTDCILGGFQCAIARSKEPVASLPGKLMSVQAIQPPAGPMSIFPAPQSGDIVEIKSALSRDASESKLPDSAVRDAILLVDMEPRDALWSKKMEALLSERFAEVDVHRFGLSDPSIKCGSTICEVAVIQSKAAAARKDDNWQTILSEVSRDGFGDSFLHSSMLMRVVDDERLAFFTYLHFDR